jgi:hypothetical protein
MTGMRARRVHTNIAITHNRPTRSKGQEALYEPRGLSGSFAPRPLRRALVEHAVAAGTGTGTHAMLGLRWYEVPTSRCCVTIVRAMEVSLAVRILQQLNLHIKVCMCHELPTS